MRHFIITLHFCLTVLLLIGCVEFWLWRREFVFDAVTTAWTTLTFVLAFCNYNIVYKIVGKILVRIRKWAEWRK